MNVVGSSWKVGHTPGRLSCTYELLDSHTNNSSGFTEVRANRVSAPHHLIRRKIQFAIKSGAYTTLVYKCTTPVTIAVPMVNKRPYQHESLQDKKVEELK